jgi:hypothetical protein
MVTGTLSPELVSIQVSIQSSKLGHGVSLQRVELHRPPVKSGHGVRLPIHRESLWEQEVASSNLAAPTV